MIAVTSPLWVWSGEGGSWHFLTIAGQVASVVRAHAASTGPRRGFGSVPVEVRIGDVVWRTSIFPQKSGSYLLPVKADVRRRAAISAGDEVTVEIRLV